MSELGAGREAMTARTPLTDGAVEAGWGAVADAFRANFAERGEVGAAVCVYADGRPVVDLWGGVADRATGRPWRHDTVVVVFSCTKGVTAVCANMVIERGLLDPAAPVAAYWPEFAAAGKEAITVEQVLSHQAGLPLVDADLTLEECLAWEPVIHALERQAPVWEPGTRHGYHMRTYGWLVGELVRRVTGETIGTFLAREVAAPLGLDLWIGLPDAVEHRVAPIIPPGAELRAAMEALGDTMLLGRVLAAPSGRFHYDEMWNTHEVRQAELPSSNGHSDARSLARLYAALLGEVDGIRLLRPDTLAEAIRPRVHGADAVIVVESAYGLGFMRPPTISAAAGPGAFGHAGAGGSLAFADTDQGIALAYVMNEMRFDMAGDPRSETLVEAAYRCC
jgi:CubicO group peptidase (beta-lactamase class C family)